MQTHPVSRDATRHQPTARQGASTAKADISAKGAAPESRPGLAARLGYPADARLLIINCDDLGASHAANVAIHRALTAGIATSATLMVPCPWAREAARMTEGLDVGVHLTLTAEYSGYRWRSLTGSASLHDAEGFLHATTREAIVRCRPQDVRAECRAQIDTALAWGVDVTHLDAHMVVLQADARLFTVYLDLAEEFRLPLRMVGARGDASMAFESRKPASERNLQFPDHLSAPWPQDVRPWLISRPARLAPGQVTEVFGHPVDDGDELRAYDPDNAALRARDAATFSDPAVADALAASGVITIGYRPLRELQRSRLEVAAPVAPHE